MGTHLRRHSAATSMLRAKDCVGRASLQAIGAMLRHQSVNSTAHDAKADVQTLQLIAQSWPERV